MVLHWYGGDHTPLQVKKNAISKHRRTVNMASKFWCGNWRR